MYVYVPIYKHAYVYLAHTHIFFKCVCFILNESAILWVGLMLTSASYVLRDLFEKEFKVFA